MKTTLARALAASLTALTMTATPPCQNAPQTVGATVTTSVKLRSSADNFVLEAGSIALSDLIQRVGAYLDYNILFNEVELQGVSRPEIKLTRRTEVDRQGCWELFGSLLYFKGFAVLALDEQRGIYEVILMQGQRGREVTSGAVFVPHDKIQNYANQRATPILTTVPLQNINATIATNALRPFFASTGSNAGAITLGNVGNNSDMLLQGFGPQVAAACRLLKLIDTGDDSGSPLIQVVRIEHAAAEDLVARIDDILGARSMQSQMQQNIGIGVGQPLRAVAHQSLNAVILSGSTTQIRDALDLIAKLDAPPVASTPPSVELARRLQQLEARVQQLEQQLRDAK